MSTTAMHAGGPAAPSKNALIARLIRRQAAVQSTIQPRPDPARAPLSLTQHKLWLMARIDPLDTSYNESFVFAYRGTVDPGPLRDAFAQLVARHETLRTTFADIDGEPVQIIVPPFVPEIAVVAVGDVPDAAREQAIVAAVADQERIPFDLARLPLFRVAVLGFATPAQNGESTYVALTFHHVIVDTWSVPILLDELLTCYAAAATGRKASLPSLPIQYGDFAYWQRRWFEAGEADRQVAYWRRALSGQLPVLDLPGDHPRPATRSGHGARIPFRLRDATAERVTALTGTYAATPFMVLLAALYGWLHRWTGQDSFVVGCPVANRRGREVEGLVGFFANTLPLRVAVDGGLGFADILHRTREVVIAALDNQDTPFERIVEALYLPRDRSRNSVFQMLFNYESAWASSGASFGQEVIRPIEVQKETSKFDLSFYVGPIRDGFEGVIEWSTDLYTAATAGRMVQGFTTFLDLALAAPTQPVGTFDLLGVAERQTVLYAWNATKVSLSTSHLLHREFERQCEATPELPALRFGAAELGYAELNRRANRLAHRLRELGAGPESVIGVAVERSLDLLPVLLGILKAGAAYMPLDPSLPLTRVATMVAEADLRVAVAAEGQGERLRGIVPEIVVAETVLADAKAPVTNPNFAVHPDNLAYVLYTSGSTGVPKASMITHRAICNRLAWMQQAYGVGPSDRILQKTAFSFDVSVWELFWPLTAGACTVLAEPGAQRDAAYLRRLIELARISVAHFVPAMLTPFLEEVQPGDMPTLRRIICSGEVLPGTAVQLAARRIPGAPVLNLYGPTEAAVDVTAWECRDDAAHHNPPIGRPIANTRIHILDARMQPVPPGVPGTLYIGGVQLARGYRNRAGLTAERFVPDPFAAGQRLYDSGDQARYGGDGAIHFLGRRDGQVKLRGFRIELGEIEAAILAHPGISQAAVILRRDEAGAGQLVGYLVPRGPAGEALADEVAETLRARLPDYMVPARLVPVPALPVTTSGKLDIAALPAPQLLARPEHVGPSTATEAMLVQVWQQILRVENISVLDNFFEIGGDSIRSVRIAALARQRGVTFPVQDLFRHQTISVLAGAIDAAGDAVAGDEAVPPPRVIDGVDVSLATIDDSQARAIITAHPDAVAIMPVAPSPWDLIAQWQTTGRPDINLVQTIGFTPNLRLKVFARVFEMLVAANPVLRTSYHWDGLAAPVQVVHRQGRVEIQEEDWRDLDEAARRMRAREVLAADGRRGAEPHLPSPWRVFFGRVGDSDYITMQTFNYISLDGWSMLTIGREMQALYLKLIAGETAQAVLRPSYATYLAWVGRRKWDDARAFWQEELRDTQPCGLTDVFRKERRDHAAGYESRGLLLPGNLTAGVRDGIGARHMTEGLFYLAAWIILLRYFTGRARVMAGVVIAGRTPEVPDVQNMIGYTMNYQPLRIDLVSDDTVGNIAEKIRRKSITLMEYDTVSLQQIRRWCGFRDDQNLFDSLFYFQNIGGFFMDGHSQVIKQQRPLAYSRTAYPLRFDIFPTVAEIGNQVFAGYEKGEFTTTEIDRIMRMFAEVIARMHHHPDERLDDMLAALGRVEADAGTPRVPVIFETSAERLW